MGHIDHGKSTLLDYIRKSNIVDKESGGITQHMSAYEVLHKDANGVEHPITFLDTPGHAAFQGMRARGANVANIAVLVVSAEDGVKTQTIEAYKEIVASNIPFIVAINKIDKPNANIEKTKQSLAEQNIYVEGYGGDIPFVSISAKVGTGVPELLDMMLLVAEMASLTGDRSKPATGVIIESNMDPQKGISATMIITDGTLEKGQYVVADDAYAPVRIMENFLGKAIAKASFSEPVRITGWSKVPQVGAQISTVMDKKSAESLTNLNQLISPPTGSTLVYTAPRADHAIIPIVLRSDVIGTLEAIELEISKLSHDRVTFKIVQKGVGAISETDIKAVAGTKNPIIIGFHVKADARATDLADRNGIPLNFFTVIYKMTEWLESEMARLSPKITSAEERGQARVVRIFSHQKDRQVLGGRVLSGVLKVGMPVKIVRREALVGEGKIIELQQQKLASKEVQEGAEFGAMIESKITIAEKDILVPFEMTTK